MVKEKMHPAPKTGGFPLCAIVAIFRSIECNRSESVMLWARCSSGFEPLLPTSAWS